MRGIILHVCLCAYMYVYTCLCVCVGAEWKLLLIGSASSVGALTSCGEVHCIEKLIVIPLTTDPAPEILGLEVRAG